MVVSNAALLFWNDWLVATRGEGLPVLEWDAAAVPMSLLVFFIVFYGQQAYQRYYQYYSYLTGMTTALMEYMSMVRRHFGDTPEGAWNAARLMLASQYNGRHSNRHAAVPRVRGRVSADFPPCSAACVARVAATCSLAAWTGTTTSRSGR